MPLRLDTLQLPDSSGGGSRELPVVVVSSGRPGPTAAVTANVHGDEVTGLAAVQALPKRLEGLLTRGTVHLYPTLNPEGLAARTRHLPLVDQDLNRVFPGDPDGSPAERLAHILWHSLASRKPDFLVDLHADSALSVPYAIVDRAVHLAQTARSKLEGHAETLAAATGLTVLREYPDKLYLQFRLDRSLSGAATNLLHIPAVTVEAGPRLFFDPRAVDVTIQAVIGVLSAAGMAERPAPLHPSGVGRGPWRRAAGPRASVAGVLYPAVRPGQTISRGELIAEVRSLQGQVLERLHASERGFVASLPERVWVAPGVAVGTLGISDST